MNEIISERAFLMVLRGLALFTPAAGGLWWLAARRRPGTRRRSAAVAIVGPAVFCLWVMYSAVTDTFGLDSMKGTALNIALFAVVGASAGLLWPRLGTRRNSDGAPRRR